MSVLQSTQAHDAELEELTPAQAEALFDARARELLHVSGAEFLAARDADSYPEAWSPQAITEMEFLVPLVR